MQVTVALIAGCSVIIWLILGLLRDELLSLGAGMLYTLGVSCGVVVLIADRSSSGEVSLERQQRFALRLLIGATVAGAVLSLLLAVSGSSQANLVFAMGAMVATTLCVYDAICVIGPN
jgi:hypothetical protein